MAKINISIDDELLKRIDSYADENYSSRSGIISLASNQFLNAEELKKAVVEMSVSFRRIADSNSVSEDDLKTLEHFTYLSQLLSKGV